MLSALIPESIQLEPYTPSRRLGSRLTLLSPLLSVVPGQLFADSLARAKGLDSDNPVALTKVTLAQ